MPENVIFADYALYSLSPLPEFIGAATSVDKLSEGARGPGLVHARGWVAG